LKPGLQRSPDSPNGDVKRWREDWREYVANSYEHGEAEEHEAWNEQPSEHVHDNNTPNEDSAFKDQTLNENEDDSVEVEGEFIPCVPEGLRTMVCFDFERRQTRFGVKEYLFWIDEKDFLVLQQYFAYQKKYSVHSKAVSNYVTVFGVRPKRLDRINLGSLVGLRAEVYVETVKPTFSVGALKGTPKPEPHHYSKVSEILRPLGRLSADSLRQLQEKCR
jgi:hypothetical protein